MEDVVKKIKRIFFLVAIAASLTVSFFVFAFIFLFVKRLVLTPDSVDYPVINDDYEDENETKEYFRRERVSGEVIKVTDTGVEIKEDGVKELSFASTLEVYINPVTERKEHIEEIREKEGGCAKIPREVFKKYDLREATVDDVLIGDTATLFFDRKEEFISQIVLER